MEENWATWCLDANGCWCWRDKLTKFLQDYWVWEARVSTRQISNSSNTVTPYCRCRDLHMLCLLLSQHLSLFNLISRLLELNSLVLANVCLRIKQSSPDLFNTSGKTQSDKIENQSIWQASKKLLIFGNGLN